MRGKFKLTLANGYSFTIDEMLYGDSMDCIGGYTFKIDTTSVPTAQSLFHKLEEYLIMQNIKNIKLEDVNNSENVLFFSFTELLRHELIINEFGSLIQFILR